MAEKQRKKYESAVRALRAEQTRRRNALKYLERIEAKHDALERRLARMTPIQLEIWKARHERNRKRKEAAWKRRAEGRPKRKRASDADDKKTRSQMRAETRRSVIPANHTCPVCERVVLESRRWVIGSAEDKIPALCLGCYRKRQNKKEASTNG